MPGSAGRRIVSPMLRRALLASLLLGCTGPPPDLAAHCPSRDEIECAIDVGGVLPLLEQGTTAGAEDGYSRSRCGVGGGVTVEDAAYRWTAPFDGTFRFSTEGSSFDTILSVRQGSCAGREILCNDDVEEGATHSALTLSLRECETVTVVIDGADATAVGAFTLRITASEALCSDGTDDDGDGLVDCEDSDCEGPRCTIDSGDWPPAWATFEVGVLEAVNRVRAEGASCGGEPQPPVPALTRDVLLEHSARLHSLDMAEQRYLAHESLDGRTLADRVADAGYEGSPIGENIAQGQGSVDEVMDGWMNSPGHCTNIMSPSYRAVGVGYAELEGGDGPRWTQNFGGR